MERGLHLRPQGRADALGLHCLTVSPIAKRLAKAKNTKIKDLTPKFQGEKVLEPLQILHTTLCQLLLLHPSHPSYPTTPRPLWVKPWT